MRRYFLFFVLVLSSCLRAEPRPFNYQGELDSLDWRWSDEATTPLYCAIEQSDVPATISVPNINRRYSLEINVAGVKVAAHRYTPFIAGAGTLVYAKFDMSSSGVRLVSIDLATGKIRWESQVVGFETGGASGYDNRVNLELRGNTVRITGKEDAGLYIETKRLSDGQTLATRVFSRTRRSKAADAWLLSRHIERPDSFLVRDAVLESALLGLLADAQEDPNNELGGEFSAPMPQGQLPRDVWHKSLERYPSLTCMADDELDYGHAIFDPVHAREAIDRLLAVLPSQEKLPRWTRLAIARYRDAADRGARQPARLELLARLLRIAEHEAATPATQPAKT